MLRIAGKMGGAGRQKVVILHSPTIRRAEVLEKQDVRDRRGRWMKDEKRWIRRMKLKLEEKRRRGRGGGVIDKVSWGCMNVWWRQGSSRQRKDVGA